MKNGIYIESVMNAVAIPLSISIFAAMAIKWVMSLLEFLSGIPKELSLKDFITLSLC